MLGLAVGLSPIGQDAGAQVFDVDKYYFSTHRMGAFQCLQCPNGGFLEGVRNRDHTRIRREFSAIQRLCIGRYMNVDGDQYVFFYLDGEPWPDQGELGVKSSSWNAECVLSVE